ncbi:Rap1a/Tai family immunity protein [Burkholderia sp. 9120]|uniref:Rap1a/Tai family immunity protein n=1 Tax=Burkholderia sp. 9120 TaxID=1500897 RepID=UPI000555AA8A|nr:Rap1a/Tai family immunity protein [Burkholderia sp. 9120]
MRFRHALIFISGLIASNANAGGLAFHGGFETGSSYNDLSVTERIGYAEGLVDGLLVSSVLTGSDRNLDMLSGCIHGMTNKQVVAVFDKYLRDNPKYWQDPMNMLALTALKETCAIAQTPPGQPAAK